VPDKFGELIVGTQLEVAVMDTLSDWMPVYIREIELQLTRPQGKIPPPRTYTTRNEFTSFPDDQMPICVVVSPGLADPPTKEGDGTYSAWWSVGVGFAAAARDADASGFVAKVYGAACRGVLLGSHSSLGGFATGLEWVDESYDDLVTEEERTIRACYDIFRVHKTGIVTRGVGPTTLPNDPASQPGSTWPTANTVKIDGINLS
jgi:hypothetical protein